MKKLLTTLLSLLTVTIVSAAVKIHICGDSMSSIYGDQSNDEEANSTYTEGMRGWGQFFGDYTTQTVQDWAHTGTTAKGFYTIANYWKAAIGTTDQSSDSYKEYLLERPYVKGYEPIAAGDYVILIWGHNDQKGSSGYKTITESEYTTYLTTMVNEVKAKGAYPILGTSICRCLFSNKQLTRLGKIDACEAAGATHPTDGSDCPYDYPQAVRSLAKKLGVPCLDLNAGSQKLWEDFGQSLSASVLFPNGGTTHTSEIGAKAVCAYANNAIAAWNADNINGATLANYSDLISSMKSGITIPKKSDFASVETTITEDMTWTFDKDKDGNTYTTKDTIATSLIDDNGLFLRATNTKSNKNSYNRYISVYAGKNNITLGDKNVATTMFTRIPAGNFSGVDADATAGMAISNTTCPLMAINTAGPGTLYVSMASENVSTSDRYLKIMFNGADSISVATTTLTVNTPVTYKVHAKEGGHFFFGGTVAYRIYAVRYIPDADTSEDDMHEPTTAITEVKNSHLSPLNTQMYNISGQKVHTGYHGIIISNGKKILK